MVMLNAQTAKSEDDFSGQSRPAPGKYHVAVNHAEEKGSKKKGTPGLELEFQVLEGTPSGQSGKTIPMFLSYLGGDEAKTKGCLDRVTRLAICCGVLRPGEAKEVDWQEAVGRELVIEIEEQDYEDDKGNARKGSQVAYMGFWSLGNKEVRAVPRDVQSPGMQALARSGGVVQPTVADQSGNGNGNGTQSGTTATIATGASTKNKWSDL